MIAGMEEGDCCHHPPPSTTSKPNQTYGDGVQGQRRRRDQYLQKVSKSHIIQVDFGPRQSIGGRRPKDKAQ